MLESPSKEQVLIQELLHKLDAERLKNARLESPFDETCMRTVCDTAKKWLSEYDLSGID